MREAAWAPWAERNGLIIGLTLLLFTAAGALTAYLNPSFGQVILTVSALLVTGLAGLLVSRIGLPKSLTVLGIMLLSGFLGTFGDYVDLDFMNDSVRWICPLLLLMLG